MNKKIVKYFKDDEYYEIPDAKFYVLSTDTYMSDWGPCEGKKSICIVPCGDIETAHRVHQYVKTRTEQINIIIVDGNYFFPTDPNILYSLVPGWINMSKEMAEKE